MVSKGIRRTSWPQALVALAAAGGSCGNSGEGTRASGVPKAKLAVTLAKLDPAEEQALADLCCEDD